MKTFIFLCSCMVFSLTPKVSLGQDAILNIETTNTLSVKKVFKLLKSQTDYNFVYRPYLLSGTPKVVVRKGEMNASDLLDKALEDTKFTFEFSENTVLVIKKPVMAVSQDEFEITGTVKNKRGDAVIGASIIVSTDSYNPAEESDPDFLMRGTQTDFDGNFKIKASEGQILTVSYLGYELYETIITKNAKVYDAILEEKVNSLDEVVLTGYTKTSKEKSTSASSKITKKDITRQKAVNLSDKLEGISPGLNISATTPSGGQKRNELILRGISTFDRTDADGNDLVDAQNSLNRQPLIVLDGFPYEGPLNDIDPQTIETIDVLRDAAATALWGIRASNGVIVITTKRGSKFELKPTISFASNVTIGFGQNLDGLQLANAEETIKVNNNFYNIQPEFTKAFGVFAPFREIGRYRPLNAYDQIWADFYNPNNPISAEQRDARLAVLAQNNVLNDFKDHLLTPGFIRENSLGIRGGSPEASYNFTATHVNQDSPDKGDKFQRLNLSLTTDFEISSRLNAVVDASLTTSEARDNGIGVAALTGGDIRIFDRLVDGNGNSRAIRQTYSENRDRFLALGFDDLSYNPILDQSLRDNSNKNFNLRLATGLNYEITDWLTADVKYQFNKITNSINNNKDVGLFETRRNNNDYISEAIEDGNEFVERAAPYGGTLENNVTSTVNTVLRGSLQFNETFSENHNVSALLGMEISGNTIERNRRRYFGYNDRTGISDTRFDSRNLPSNGFGPSAASYLRGSVGFSNSNAFVPEVESRAISSFANVGYSYRSKYNINASGKIDQTTAFGINQRLSKPLLWAVSGSWDIARENFFKVSWIDNLKFRGSYGVNGNLRRGLTTRVTIGFEGNNDINGLSFAEITSAGNPNLTFEETVTKNIGLDFGFFDNRIRGTIDLYDRLSENLLVPFNINETFGQSNSGSVLRNDGSISNRGVEFNLNIDAFKKKAVGWNSNFNISYNKNEVLAFTENSNFTDTSFFLEEIRDGSLQITGSDISTQYRYEWAGLDREGNPQVFNENGDIIGYQDDLPSIDALIETKPFIAPIFGGFRNTFTYKNVGLSFLTSFKFGHIFQESLDNKDASAGGDRVFHRDIANAWQFPGDEFNTDIPALPRNSQELNSFARAEIFTNSNLGLQNASFVRLRDVTLAYNLENAATERIGLNGINFTLQARNLGIVWRANDIDLDPESVPFVTENFNGSSAFSQAFRPGIIPPVTLVLGVNLNF